MSRLLYVDAIGGAAGDMLLAALLDAGAPEREVAAAVEAVLPGRFLMGTEEVRRAELRARYLRVRGGLATAQSRLESRSHTELLAAVDRAGLPSPTREGARAVLMRLGEAEARVHGTAIADLVLDELGDDDTLLDVVGVVAALHELRIDRILVAPLPMGWGMLPPRDGHGGIPLPATVTLDLLQGFAVRAGGRGETVTPTAAAILSALGSPATRFPSMTIEGVGYGAGARDPADHPNVVRVVIGIEVPEPAAGTAAPAARGSEPGPRQEIDAGDIPDAVVRRLVVVEANLDDLTAELAADAARAILAAGALDVWTAPIVMKKGRAGHVLSALCGPEAEARVRRAFFDSTTTFGVRSHEVRRTELARRMETVAVGDGTVRVKVAVLGGRVVTAMPEHDDVAEMATRLGRPVREVYEDALAAARAIRFQGSER